MSAPSCNCGACKFGYSCKSYSAWRSAPPGRPPLDVRGLTPFLELRELRHELRLSSLRGAQTTTKLRRSGCIAASAASRGSSAPGEVRLARFMAVLELLGTAPWASKRFEVNEKILRRMVASHMTLIVGGANVRPELYSLLEQYEDWSGSQNLVWVTNRQQGKTSTLSRFVACLAHMSCAGGQLMCIYSVSLDRAQEVLKGAKRYLYWLQEPAQASKLNSLGAGAVTVIEDNQRLIRLRSPYSSLNTVTARPKNPDSCRGDAPKAAVFDEIAFVTPNFWYQFSYPLLQVGKRVFTCTTTPPALGSFFAVFIDSVKQANANGDHFFRLVNHSLACAACLERDRARECVHRLSFIPPWKSLLRFTQMKQLVPAKRQLEYEQEVYGVIKADGNRYFPEKIVKAVFSRAPLTQNPGISTVWLGIDPASHFRSFMGLAAVALVGGRTIILGLESVGMARTDIFGMQRSVATFVRAIDSHPFCRGGVTIVPVIECNSSEVTALTILNTVNGTAQATAMPFVKSNFATGISDGIGVFTTQSNKLAAITHAYTAFVQLSIFHPTGIDTDLLAEQLCAFHDDPQHGPTGKTSAGGEDDLAMAFLLATYWGFCASVRQ